MRRLAVMVAVLLAASTLPADEVTIVNSFETEGEIADWEVIAGRDAKLIEGPGVTHGGHALEITFDPQGKPYPVYIRRKKELRDWSKFDTLVIDVFNPNAFPVGAGVHIGDEAWRQKATYWNRHNAYPKLAPGKGQIRIPVHGLFRGEAGGRNKDLNFNIDPSKIMRFDLKFGNVPQTGTIVLDHIRFVRGEPRPEGVWAFDFGPESQAVMAGWTAVGRETSYTPERRFGWEGGIPPIGSAARDTTFGPVLTRDFVEAGGCTFRIDVPPGRYDVLAFFENCGYWGQEQARHAERRILSGGKVVWSERRPDGKSTALFRFEDVEPVGVDIWETYMLPEITKPVRFTLDAGADGLKLRFEADVVWGSRIAALAVCRADDPAGRRWTDAQIATLAGEFRTEASCLDPPAPKYTPPATWAPKSLVAWPVKIEDEITPNSVPKDPPDPAELRLTAEALRGEYESVSVAIRPTKDLGTCTARVEWPKELRPLPVTVWSVRYGTSRRGSIAYHITPSHLLPAGTLNMPKDLTRQFIVTFKVPENARPGTYRPVFVLLDARRMTIRAVPIALTVHDVTLRRETEFLMGMYGLYPPRLLMSAQDREKYLEETLVLMRDYGMNALVEEPTFTVTGWKDGRPEIDFAEADRFFALCRKHGFTRGIRDHGTNFRNLHGWYEKGSPGRRTEQQSGLDFETAMMRAFEALDAHARANAWPVLFYKMCDETRVREEAERQLEFMKLIDRIHKRFPDTLEPLGSYSVHFRTRPTDRNDMLYWHQRFFENLAVSNLNNHDETVLDEARKLGRKVHIYNQGTSRWSFGMYQWSEYRKGVAARWQWHTNILHGYQFFDLDGREPDTSMILYGREGLYTTLRFERCREGAEDFYLYQTLDDLIQSNRRTGRKPDETAKAEALLAGATDRVRVNERDRPAWFDPYEFKRSVVAAIMEIR